MYSVGPPMAMEYSCAQILSHDFMQGLARELEFDQGAHRHTADLDNGNVDISVDISTKCREPSAYAVSGGYGETLWSRGLGRGKRKKKRRGRKVEGTTCLAPSQCHIAPSQSVYGHLFTRGSTPATWTYLGRTIMMLILVVQFQVPNLKLSHQTEHQQYSQ